MQHPCRLFIHGQQEVERFDAVAFLADRIHQLRQGKGIETYPVNAQAPDFSGSAVRIQIEGFEASVLAVIGEPEYAAEHQDRLLCGALYRLNPERGAA